jgi:plasmid stability protein
MAAITIRNLSEAAHRALKRRAAEHGRSTEAEVRDILESAVRPKERIKLGSELAEFGRRLGGFEIEAARDAAPPRPATFE